MKLIGKTVIIRDEWRGNPQSGSEAAEKAFDALREQLSAVSRTPDVMGTATARVGEVLTYRAPSAGRSASQAADFEIDDRVGRRDGDSSVVVHRRETSVARVSLYPQPRTPGLCRLSGYR